MAVTIPIEIYEVFEEVFGMEKAKKIVKSLEAVISFEIDNKWYQTKTELKEELLKEVATKKDIEVLEAKIESVRSELDTKIERVRSELDAKIERVRSELDAKIERVATELDAKIEKVASDLDAKIERIRGELDAKIENVRVGLDAKIDRVNLKLNFLIILMIIALALMNPVVAEALKNLLIR
jgi:DNA anti-recombination protein RmuC